ncbi:MAG: hypothetical protein GWO81_04110, partial [Verrucomicrobia bacterium]|nr:hypothetical protein [Verrucomicrobiota bacterium]
AVVTALICVATPEQPHFISEGLYSPNAAPVKEVLASENADLVVLEGGTQQGFRKGMICRIERDSRTVGEVIIIASQHQRAAALILQIAPETTIQAGDIARIQTIQNS